MRLASGNPRSKRAETIAAPAPFDIPSAPTQFIGRQTEVDQVDRLFAKGSSDESATVIVIHGMAGIGKTSLVLHLANRMRTRFPDGALFLEFGSDDRGRTPLTVAEALDRLLRRLGVPGDAVPTSVDERAAQYRNVLNGKRVLLVLDNVRRADQVAALIPGSGASCVLVTSRGQLRALDGATLVYLRPLDGPTATSLFWAVAGDQGSGDDLARQRAVAQILAACAGLPLAVRVAAARCRSAPLGTLEALAASILERRSDLDPFDDGERSVYRVLLAALAELPAPRRDLLGLLSISPTGPLTLESAAWLAGSDTSTVGVDLSLLQDAGLIISDAGRLGLHDLVRLLAGHQASIQISESRRTMALRRLVVGYVHTLHGIDARLNPYRFRRGLDAPPEKISPLIFADNQAALDWCAAELDNVVAVCRLAWTLGWDTECWQIAYAMRGYFFLTKTMDAWVVTHRLALNAAQRSKQSWAEAVTRNNLGLAFIEQGMAAKAEAEYQLALALFEELGDRPGQAATLGHQAWSCYVAGHYQSALDLGIQALAMYETQPRGQAITLRAIALAKAQLDQHASAVADLQRALRMFEAMGLSMDVTMTLNCLGEVHTRQGLYRDARHAHARALLAARACESEYEQARARAGLGDVAALCGCNAAALRLFEAARRTYMKLGSAIAVTGLLERPAGQQVRLPRPGRERAIATAHSPQRG